MKRLARYGLLVALAIILSYVESLIPLPFFMPGMKLGLANIVVLMALYTLRCNIVYARIASRDII